MIQNKCPNCNEPIVEQSVVNSDGKETIALLNLDGKFHVCAVPKPLPKAAAKSTPKEMKKKVLDIEEIKKSVATETSALAYENACDAVATALKMKYFEVDALVKERMKTYNITGLEALEGFVMEKNLLLAKILGLDKDAFIAMMKVAKENAAATKLMPPPSLAAPSQQTTPQTTAVISPPQAPSAVIPPKTPENSEPPYTSWAECPACHVMHFLDPETGQCKSCDKIDHENAERALAESEREDSTKLAIKPQASRLSMVMDGEDPALDDGVSVPFDDAIAILTRSLLSVEKAAQNHLVLKFMKMPIIKRRSKFFTDEKDEDGKPVYETDDKDNIIMTKDEKSGKMVPKIKKYRMINYWFVMIDKGGNEYLLNVNKGMQKAMASLRREPGGLDNWFTVAAEGTGKTYKVTITLAPVKP